MRDTGRRSFIQGLAGVSAAGMLGAAWHVRAAQTQAWPARPIKLVVTFPPGGSSDIVARVLAPALAEKLGQSVVIDNKPGAGSSIGAQIVAHSANDGYTLLVSNSAALSIAPSLLQSPGYDPLRSFEHLAYIGAVPTVFAVHPSVPANSLSELVSWIKEQPAPWPLAAAALPRWGIWWASSLRRRSSCPWSMCLIAVPVPCVRICSAAISSWPSMPCRRTSRCTSRAGSSCWR
jgi:tripartite-type tricarboxylate transporter receptor subunit TctC